MGWRTAAWCLIMASMCLTAGCGLLDRRWSTFSATGEYTRWLADEGRPADLEPSTLWLALPLALPTFLAVDLLFLPFTSLQDATLWANSSHPAGDASSRPPTSPSRNPQDPTIGLQPMHEER